MLIALYSLHWTSDVCQLFIKSDCKNNGREKHHEHYQPRHLTAQGSDQGSPTSTKQGNF